MERNITAWPTLPASTRCSGAPRQRPPQRRAGPPRTQRAGAVGACVQKIAEAEVLAAGGVRDITLTNQVVAPKLLRVARLAARLQAQGGRLALAVDSPEGITRLAEAMAQAAPQTRIDVLVEIDVGHWRCGVPPGEPRWRWPRPWRGQAVALCRAAGLPGPGAAPAQRRRAPRRRGHGLRAVSAPPRPCIRPPGPGGAIGDGGGTGTLVHEGRQRRFGELQAGTFLFMDADYARNEREPAQPAFEHALYVKTQVISRQGEARRVRRRPHQPCHRRAGVPRWPPAGEGQGLPQRGDEHGILTAETDETRCPPLAACCGWCPATATPVNLHDTLIGRAANWCAAWWNASSRSMRAAR